MKKSVSRQLFMVLLLLSAFAGWASVSIRGAAVMGNDKDGSVAAPISAAAPINDPIDLAAVRQIGQDMGDAMVAGDIEKLNQIFADDWATIDSSGKIFTKEPLLTDFKS